MSMSSIAALGGRRSRGARASFKLRSAGAFPAALAAAPSAVSRPSARRFQSSENHKTMNRRTYVRTAAGAVFGSTALTTGLFSFSGSAPASSESADEDLPAAIAETTDADAGDREVWTDGFCIEHVEVFPLGSRYRVTVTLRNPAHVSHEVETTIEVETYEDVEDGGFERFGTAEVVGEPQDGGDRISGTFMLDREGSYRIENNPVAVSVSQPIDRSILPTEMRKSWHGIEISGRGVTASDRSGGVVRIWFAREKPPDADADWRLESLDAVEWSGSDATAGVETFEFASSYVAEGDERIVTLAAEAATGSVVRSPDARLFPEFMEYLPRERGVVVDDQGGGS